MHQQSNPFAAVILDGDGAVFRNDLLAKGHEGGVKAARELLRDVKEQLKTTYPKFNIDDWSIFVQIVLYLPGLANKLSDLGIIRTQSELTEFIRGFNYSQPTFSIIDVGRGKENADHKCREMVHFMARFKQCKHLFFGPCHDKGYIPPLQHMRARVAERLTLIETTPAEPDFRRELNLPIAKLTVFRSEPLPDGQPRQVAAQHQCRLHPPGRFPFQQGEPRSTTEQVCQTWHPCLLLTVSLLLPKVEQLDRLMQQFSAMARLPLLWRQLHAGSLILSIKPISELTQSCPRLMLSPNGSI